ncbi:MAG: type II toxin-antitoxin system VapC family toxin [Methylovulum sp.]|uniref:type II toxin-antitoxin system VapC family toxin n=1 Tax=Methylovulum sp. TaxID=1916980 RepID=UPI00262A7243|nr:type II toxin-antitoxin system VapC family toxin [Methylovulum sp.]MDD2724185.1 type II toxin-antitoxin system VapC family toxin [Methylovulum sp.]MDD5123217.1 type II toxin-antitoxin system VapC family toxin [Methylovulum sp.]
MIVADTNTIAYLYLNSDKSAQAEQLLMLEPKWIAPGLWKSEFRSVLSHYLHKNLLTFDEVLLIVQQAESLMLDSDYEVSSAHILQLVNASNCSAYDCEFVALAKLVNIPLITADKKVLNAFPTIAQTITDFIAKNSPT